MFAASKTRHLLKLAIATALIGSSSGVRSADDYDTIFSGILNTSGNTSSQRCTECHTLSSPNTTCGTAPDFTDYDVLALSSAIVDTAFYVKPGDSYMPLNPSTCATDGTVGNLQAADVNDFLAWDTAGRPKGAPVVTAESATNRTNISARLNATINPNVYASTSVPGSYRCEYGLSNSYGSNTSTIGSFTGTSGTAVFANISNLRCNETYHYRAVGYNGAHTGGVDGGDNTFNTTACTAPTIDQGTSTAQVVSEGSSMTFGLSVTEDDFGTLNWSISSGPSKGTADFNTSSTDTGTSVTVRYTASGNNIGSDSFVVQVQNAHSSQTDTITVNMTINDDGTDSPVITSSGSISLNEDNSAADDATTSASAVTISALDPDNSPNYFWDVSVAGDGAVNFGNANAANPSMTYTPLQDDFGTPADSFTVRVCDAGTGTGNCDTQAFTVNLTARRDSPDAVADSGTNILEGSMNNLINVHANDTDTDAGQQLTLTPINISVLTGDITINGVINDGGVNKVDVTHNGAEESSASFQYRAQDSDGLTSGLVTVSLGVTGTDDDPTTTSFTHGSTINEGSTGNTIDVIAQSNDPEMATMAVCTSGPLALGGATYGSLSVNGFGEVVYDHDGTNVVAASTDTDSFTYAVNDANDASCTTGNNSNQSTVTINLAFVNDEPVPVADAFTVAEGGTFDMTGSDVLDTGPGNGSLFDNDTDEELDTLQLGSNTSPAHSSGFAVDSDGDVTYTHNGNEITSDSFTYVVNDGSDDSLSSGTVSITITPVNDQPAVTENAPAAVFTEDQASAYDHTFAATDNDTVSGGDVFTWSITSGQTGDMNIVPGSGRLTWTPERTGVFNDASRSVTVRATDDDKSTAGANPLFDEYTFNITTSPPDGDGDGIPDYVDNCVAVSNADQADMDMDTTAIGGASLITSATPSSLPGYPNLDVDHAATDPANALGESYARGGDACDEDVDGDGMSKAFEDSIAFLSDTDPSDAALDEDGDGLSNLQEFLANSDPAVDSVGPSITAPADVTVNATGYLTVVDVGEPIAIDGNEGAVLSVKAAVDANPPIDIDDPRGCGVLDDWESTVPALRPGRHTITWITCDSQGNLAKSTDQIVIVRPLVSVTSGQNIGEGQTAVVNATLNGEAPSYPVSINYSVGGFSNPGTDHDAASGVITVSDPDVNGTSPGVVGRLSVNIIDDMVSEPDESIFITLDTADHAAISVSNVHAINIVGSNVAPQVNISVTQNAINMGSVVFVNPAGGALVDLNGDVVLTANSYDANGDTLSYQWRDTDDTVDIATSGSTSQTLVIDAAARAALAAGVYPLSVEVSDGNLSTTASIELVVIANEPALGAVDSDGDNINDDVEGAGDTDGDGVPDYLDDANLPSNVVQNQTGSPGSILYLETELGLRITTGTTANASSSMGATITRDALKNFGGSGGGPASNTEDDFTLLGGVFDFVITGLGESQTTANVVLPLPIAMLPDAVYRKYDGTSWGDFVINAQNIVWSAAGEPGVCPSPGSSEYAPGLGLFHYCVQLTIEDGGPNDADGVRNFVIRDPGAVAVPDASDADASAASADERLGMLSPLWLLLLPVAVWVAYRRRT